MIRFFANSTPVQDRAELVEVCGQMLARTPAPAPEVIDRLQRLWEWRSAEATAGRADVNELSSFGWWFTSPHHDVGWDLTHLSQMLAAGGGPEPTHMVAERLSELRHSHLRQVVECTAQLIDAPTDRWFVAGSQRNIFLVLADGVASTDDSISTVAREIASRLVARGNPFFADLFV